MATTDMAMDTRRIHVLLLRTLRFGPKSFWELMRAGQAQTHQVLEALQELLKHELIACEEDRFVHHRSGTAAGGSAGTGPGG